MLKVLGKYWHFAILAIFFMICEVTVDMIQPKLMATIVDDGILGLGGSGRPDIDLVTRTGIIMILIVIGGGISGILSGTMANLCSQRFGNDIRKMCFARIMHLSFEQTDMFTTGSLITRVTNDVTQLERLVQQSVRGFVRCLMFMVAGTYTLLSLNQHFLVILAIAFPLVLADIIFILWKTNPLFLRLQRRIDSMNTVIRENINGVRVVKAFVQESREDGRFEKANRSLSEVQLRILILMSALRPIMNIILNLATVALIWVGALHVRSGGMLPGEVMAAVTYISQILGGMMMLAMIFQTLSRGMASYRRIREVLDAEPVITDGRADAPSSGPSVAQSQGSVEFEDVSFAYPKYQQPASSKNAKTPKNTETDAPDPARAKQLPGDISAVTHPSIPVDRSIRELSSDALSAEMEDDGMVLRGISLRVSPGETLAVIGATGCGKSTLVSLIPRFYDVSGGRVLVDGQDVKSFGLKELRGRIAFVPQKNELFTTTIMENIRMGAPGASDDDVRRAARYAQAEGFILEQPNGYDTPVAEGGMSLSGGQRQRIAIARALLKNSEILIFDDSTSALDLKTEAALYDALQTNYTNTTRIVIAQRITTARRADRIAVLEGGRLAGCGTHEELLKDCGVYRDICESQEAAPAGGR